MIGLKISHNLISAWMLLDKMRLFCKLLLAFMLAMHNKQHRQIRDHRIQQSAYDITGMIGNFIINAHK